MGKIIKGYGLWALVTFMTIFVLLPQISSAKLKKSHEFGNVVMENNLKDKGQMPVVFRHWIHRSKHSCRLCHVDIEFGMDGETDILEEDNKDGRYCGVCHNSKEAFDISECSKCHPKNAKDAKEQDRKSKKAFFKFKKKMPRSVYGNKIDWNIAEEDGSVKVKDYIEGLTFESATMVSNMRNEPMTAKLPGMPDIIFSHKKHVAWTGCGMCHPAPFSLEAGKTKMSMKEISQGKFCGVCHGSVAFPLNDCGKCHSKPVK